MKIAIFATVILLLSIFDGSNAKSKSKLPICALPSGPTISGKGGSGVTNTGNIAGGNVNGAGGDGVDNSGAITGGNINGAGGDGVANSGLSKLI